MTYSEQVLLFLSLLKREMPNYCLPEDNAENIAVYVGPWLNTLTPYYSMVLALLLRKQGYSPVLVWDDLISEQYGAGEVEGITVALAIMEDNKFPVVRLSQCSQKTLDVTDKQEILRLARLCALWWYKSVMPGKEFAKVVAREHGQLSRGLSSIRGFFDDYTFGKLILPGGIFRNSGLMLYAGKRAGVVVTTFDSGTQSVSAGVGTVAAHLDDVPIVFRDLFQTDPEFIQIAQDIGKPEFERRLLAKDKYAFQLVASSSTSQMAADVLFPLNLDSDSSALGKHELFLNTYDWLNKTIRHILRTSSATIAIRQHPYENRLKNRNDSMIDYLENEFQNSGRVRVIRCDEQVNSYDLVRNARLVLPFVTSLGVESVLMGRPMVPVARSFYAGLSFSPLPADQQEYFERITKILTGSGFVYSQKQIKDAWGVYYLSQVCGRIWTNFTPQSVDGEKWLHMSIEELFASSEVQAVLSCLADGQYISKIQHCRIKLYGVEHVYKQ